MASVFLRTRGTRFAVAADIVPPDSTRSARLALVEGCDTVGMDSDTLVETTFIDSQGRGWRRDSRGTLKRRKIRSKRADAELWARRHRGAALHQVREWVEPDDQGREWHRARDAQGYEVDVTVLERPATEDDADALAFPAPIWQPRPEPGAGAS